MNILKSLSKEEIELLKNIGIEILNKKYEKAEIKEIEQSIYNRGYLDTKITYADAEKYRQIYERFKYLTRIDLEKVQKYTRKEFEEDYYLCTVIMHGAVWNNPSRINKIREARNKNPLTEEKKMKYQEKFEENSKKLSEYTKKLEEKYGGELSMVDRYYSTIEKSK